MTLVVLAFSLAAYPAWAADWRVVEVSGGVRIASPGHEPEAPAAGRVLTTGTSVTTAGGGRAVLTNGDQRIVVGPNSRMTVAAETQPGMVRVMQDLGSILFQVDKKPAKHFRVETTLLAAVVKGTTFTVNAGPMGDSVHVAEGLVEVHANNGGAVSDVPAGVTANVTRMTSERVDVIRPVAEAAPEPAAQALAPLDYKEASSGLIENLPAPTGQAWTAAGPPPVNGGPSEAQAANAPTEPVEGFRTAAATGESPAVLRTLAAVASPGANDGARVAMADIGNSGGGSGASPGGSANGNNDTATGGAGSGPGNAGGGGNGNADNNPGPGPGAGSGSGSGNGNGNETSGGSHDSGGDGHGDGESQNRSGGRGSEQNNSSNPGGGGGEDSSGRRGSGNGNGDS